MSGFKNETASPAWKMLGGDLHMHTLSQNYAPVGLLQMIASPPRRVLDVGCFCGGTGQWLKSRFPSVEVTGIEFLSAAAERARSIYDRVIEKSVENLDFDENGLHPASMDVIVAADVLEHLMNPWQTLQRLRPLLAPGGALYVSLPNIRNLSILMGLARGEWRYQGHGILDITHLRFFTRAQAIEMLGDTGWRVDELLFNPDPDVLAAFGGRDPADIKSIDVGNLQLKNLNPIDVMELIALQFFIRAVPAVDNTGQIPALTPAPNPA